MKEYERMLLWNRFAKSVRKSAEFLVYRCRLRFLNALWLCVCEGAGCVSKHQQHQNKYVQSPHGLTSRQGRCAACGACGHVWLACHYIHACHCSAGVDDEYQTFLNRVPSFVPAARHAVLIWLCQTVSLSGQSSVPEQHTSNLSINSLKFHTFAVEPALCQWCLCHWSCPVMILTSECRIDD